MKSKTLGLLFTTTQNMNFLTRFKAFETKFTVKTSLRTFLIIYMALSQRLTQVRKIPTSWSCRNSTKSVPTRSPCRVEQLSFLLHRKPTVRSAGILERKCSLSKKNQKSLATASPPLLHVLALYFKRKRMTLLHFCLFQFNNFNNSHHVPFLDF